MDDQVRVVGPFFTRDKRHKIKFDFDGIGVVAFAGADFASLFVLVCFSGFEIETFLMGV